MKTRNSYILEGLNETSSRVYFPTILGNSPDFLLFLTEILSAANRPGPVVLQGETGVGKSTYAEYVWKNSPRRDQLFTSVDLATIHTQLVLSDLIGHSRGSFTGAYSDRVGLIEKTNNGVILFENLEDITIEAQRIIIKILDEGTLQRLGDSYARQVDVKIIATSKNKLSSLAKNNVILPELFYRLSNAQIHVPSLKELQFDLIFIARCYCTDILNVEITNKALEAIAEYTWPGNFRELFSCLQGLKDTGQTTINHNDIRSHLKETEFYDIKHGDIQEKIPENFKLDYYLEAIEKKIIETALHETNGLQSLASRKLGIKERSLWHRIKKFNINPDEFKNSLKFT